MSSFKIDDGKINVPNEGLKRRIRFDEGSGVTFTVGGDESTSLDEAVVTISSTGGSPSTPLDVSDGSDTVSDVDQLVFSSTHFDVTSGGSGVANVSAAPLAALIPARVTVGDTSDTLTDISQIIFNASHFNVTSGGAGIANVAALASGGSLDVDDTSDTVADVTQLTFAAANFNVTGSAGHATVTAIPPVLDVTTETIWSEVVIGDRILVSDTANMTFSSIAQTYDELEIHLSLRTDVAAITDAANISFNGDTVDANYDFIYQDGQINVTVVDNATGKTNASRAMVDCCGNTADASTFSGGTLRIPEYSKTTKNKIVEALSAHVSNFTVADGSITLRACLWENTAAITDIVITPLAGSNFKAGSRAILIGRKSQVVVTGVSLA